MTLEPGTLGEWVGALASSIGLLLSIFALKQSGQANTISREAQRDAKDAEKERKLWEKTRDEQLQAWEREQADEVRIREEGRDNREISNYLSSMWVKILSNGPHARWGLLIVCQHPVHNVRINVLGNDKSPIYKAGSILPGRYFVESLSLNNNADYAWGNMESMNDSSILIPIGNSKKMRIQSVRFSSTIGGEPHTFNYED